MKKDKLLLYLFSITLLIVLFLFLYFSNVFTLGVLSIIIVIFSILITLFIKKKRILSVYNRQVQLAMLIFGVLYVTIFYLLGIYFGFSNNYFSFSIENVFNYMIPIVFIIIFSEFIRSKFLTQEVKITIKSKSFNLFGLLNFVSMILIEVLLYLTIYGDLSSYDDYMTLIGLIVFASISYNLLYNYISKRFGARPIIIFRLITTLYSFIFPIIPKVFIFFRSFLRMISAYFIYIFLDKNYEKKTLAISKGDKRKDLLSVTGTLLIMTLFVMLISCKFYYGVLVVGSGSMTGTIDTGDVVIFKQFSNDKVKTGDIIVFNNADGSRTIHRVVEIKTFDNENRYYTKGDANLNQDEGYITDDLIMGIVKFHVKYIGYPTLWLKDILS